MKILVSFCSLILSAILKLFWFFELFLFLRLVLKFLGANPQTLAVDLVYRYTDIAISPFAFIFRDVYWREYLIETSTISAMVGYAIIVFIIFKVLKLFVRDY